jgi:hypothetical protein
MKRRGWVAASIALAAVAALLVPSAGVGAASGTYAGASTLVAKQSGQEPLLDDGGAVCFTQSIALMPNGLGGGCLSFPIEGRPPAILVQDSSLTLDVAFQVCVDMNQDGHCYMNPEKPPGICDDVVGFSHADNGVFFNPLGSYIEPVTGILKPLPTSLPPPGLCSSHGSSPLPRPAWPGYIVFLCEGVHLTDMPHAHTPTTGTIQVVQPPQPQPGAGNFCQTIRDNFKEYYLLP